VKHAAIEYLIAFSFERRPEYVRKFGEEPRANGAYDRATALMGRIAKAIQRLPDQAAAPANVGGDTTSVADDPRFPCPPKPTFEDMGDF